MNRSILLPLLIFISIVNSTCQSTEPLSSPKPILLDKSVLSGVGLKKIDLKDEPEKEFFQKRLLRGEDISVYVVSTESWINKIENYPFDEYIFMLHGESIARPREGREQTFYTSQHFFAPKGFTGEWEVSAGDNLHYELSVISTHRDSIEEDVEQHHRLIDPSVLSGVDIKFNKKGKSNETIIKGAELTIKLHAEKPQDYIIDEPYKEALLSIQSGQLTLTPLGGEPRTYYSGDFVVVPSGFLGKWSSEGHGMLKYLSIAASQ